MPSPATTADPIAEAALLALHHQGIRPTPEAYTLWYRHLAGERPDLSRRLADLEARGEPFDAALIGELFERYIGGDGLVQQVSAASHAVERLLADLAGDLDTLEADAQSRGDRLDAIGADLASDGTTAVTGTEASHAALRNVLADILEEAAAMRRAAYRLQCRAVAHAGEVAQLRATIEASGLAEARDPMTGVARPKALQRALRRAAAAVEGDRPEITAASGSGAPEAGAPCFMIVDLDAFSAFNKAHGRALADLVLKSVARHLGSALAPGDALGRLDGATFGIILARTGLAGGEVLAERLCAAVAAMRVAPDSAEGDAELGRGPEIPPVTVAIGIAGFHPGEPLARLIGRADRARRSAKEAGGNRVVSERATTIVGRPKTRARG